MGEGQIRSVHNVEPTLEDVFLHLTGREVREQVAYKITAPARRRRGMRPGSQSDRQSKEDTPITMNIKTILSHSLWVAWKDLTEIWRNRLVLVMLIRSRELLPRRSGPRGLYRYC